MKNHKRLLMVGITALLALGACDVGDNKKWEARMYKGAAYTDSRTAGTGFKWVLVTMAPRKGVILDPIMDKVETETTETTEQIEEIVAPIVPPAVKISRYIPVGYDDIAEATPILPLAQEEKLKDASPIFYNKIMK